MKPDYALIKRSKVNANIYAFVYDGDVLIKFSAAQLLRALHVVKNTDTINDVDVMWRDGTRTAEVLRLVEKKHFATFNTAEYDYHLCLPMRAQGLPVDLSVPVDVRTLFDSHGTLISEIRVPCEIVADLKPMLERYSALLEDDEDEDEDEDEDDIDWDADDDEDEDDPQMIVGMRPDEARQQLSDFNYRAPDWAVTLTDTQVERVHILEVGVDPDVELPIAEDAKEEWF